MKKDDKLSWGITLLFFGILFLLKVWGHAPRELAQYAFDVRNYPIIIGVIFLIFNDTRSIGITLLILGLFMRIEYLIHLTRPFSVYIIPALMIVIGAVFVVRKGK
jgi:hypothetical protein